MKLQTNQNSMHEEKYFTIRSFGVEMQYNFFVDTKFLLCCDYSEVLQAN